MLHRRDSKLDYFEFSNIYDFKRYLDMNMDKLETTNTLQSNGNWAKFSAIESWDAFEQLLIDGNPDITAEMKKWTKYYIDKFEQYIAEKPSWQFDVVGQFFDIGAVLVGEPEAWLNEILVEDDKFIKLKIQGSYRDGTDLKKVRENGAKLFAIAVALEQQGYLVEIDMLYRIEGANLKNEKQVTECVIPAKKYDQPLDYKKFGILLSIPFFRRGVLRLLEIEYGKNTASGYGKPKKMEGEINLDNTNEIDEVEMKLKEVA